MTSVFTAVDGFEAPEAYYHNNASKLAKAVRMPSGGTIKTFTEDPQLLAFLLLSPAHLMKLQDKLRSKVNERSLTLLTNANELETIAVIRYALDGITFHFGESELEEGWRSMMNHLDEFLQEGETEIANGLRKQIISVGNLFISKKRRFSACEKSVMSLSTRAFARDYGLPITLREQCSDIIGSVYLTMLACTFPDIWQPIVGNEPGVFVKRKVRAWTVTSRNAFINTIRLITTITTFPLVRALVFFYYITSLFSINRIALFIIDIAFSRKLGRNYKRNSMYLAASTLLFIVPYVRRARQKFNKNIQLQARGESPEHKKLQSSMAALIMFVYIFNTSLGDALNDSLSKIARLANMLVEDDRGMFTALSNFRLQADDERDDDNNDDTLCPITDVSSLFLHVTDETEFDDAMLSTDETFQNWIALNNETARDYTRPLQYHAGHTFALNAENVKEVAALMVETSTMWNQVVGLTGSGKSTRLPVAYYHALKATNRPHRILICEPTRASTMNVNQGISSNFRKTVYGKHEGWEQLGCMDIQVMTYGSALFRQLSEPRFLAQFDAIFLDESHLVSEHSLTLEGVCNNFRDLRKFYVSATPRDGTKSPDVHRRYPIHKTESMIDSPAEWMKSQGTGDALDVTRHSTILVFLAGKNECDKMASKWNGAQISQHTAYALHGDNMAVQYKKIVNSLDSGSIIVFSTNILETGVTLNVDCVVDFGYTMRPELSLTNHTLRLVRKRVTENEREQRIGRAGRLKDGYAITCGKVDKSKTIVPPETLYGAAIMSFVHNVQMYVNEKIDTSWLLPITKAQATTMSSFKLSPFITKDLVDADGSVHSLIAPILAPFTYRTTELKVNNKPIPAHLYQSWPPIYDYLQSINRGEKELDRTLSKMKVPFIVPHQHDLDWEKLARVCDELKPSMKTAFRIVNGDDRVRMLTLHTNKHNIQRSILLIESIIANVQTKLKDCRVAQRNLHSSMFLSYFNLNEADKRIAEKIKKLEHNHRVLVTYRERLMQDMSEHGATIAYEQDVEDNVMKMLELQASGTVTEEDLHQILGLEKQGSSMQEHFLKFGPIYTISVSALMVAGLSYCIIAPIFEKDEKAKNTPAEERQGHFVVEGKGKKYDRSKRMDIPQEEKDRFEEYNERVSRKASKLMKKTRPETSVRYKKPAFYNLYDISTDENVLEAIFQTEQGEVFFRTPTPIADMKAVNKMFNQQFPTTYGKVEGMWADTEEDEEETRIQCIITMKDGRRIQTTLTPHDPTRITPSFKPVGYHEREHELRQTGDTTILSNAKNVTLEAAAEIPLATLSSKISSSIGYMTVDGHGLNCFIYKDWIIMPAHAQLWTGEVIMKFEGGVIITTTQALNEYVVRFPQHDLILVPRPHSLPPTKVYARATTCTTRQVVQMVYCNKVLQRIFTNTDYATPATGTRFTHAISTFPGMCGCPVVNNSNGTLLGIHVGANKDNMKNEFQTFSADIVATLSTPPTAFKPRHDVWTFTPDLCGYERTNLTLQASFNSNLITQMNETISGFGADLVAKYISPPNVTNIKTFEKIGFKAFELIGYMPSNLLDKHTIIGQNKYLQEFLQLNTSFQWVLDYFYEYAPSCLDYEAYFKDVTKFDRHPNIISHDIPTFEASKAYLIRVLQEAGLTPCKRKTAEEVVRDIQWSTSSGAAYAFKKGELLSSLSDDEVIQFAQKCHDKFTAGEAPGIWNGSLKAELRPVEKVEAKKTRVFTAAPITSLMAMKFYVDDFNKKFYKTHLKAPHTVGINKFNRGWEKLYHKLNKPGWLHGSGDGSRFDSSIDPFFFEAIKDIRQHFFDGEYRDQLDIIYDEILNTPICLANGLVIRKCVGNNSGQPSTVVDNTLTLMLSFYYAYARKTGDLSFDNIDDNFIFVCNGDDNKFAISPEFVANFGSDFSPELKELGLTYEFDDITDDITLNPYMSLTMVRTKHGVGFTLPVERIISIMQWAKKGGVLHAYLSGIAAAMESFNTPRLFNFVYTYLYWLIRNYEDELITLMEMNESFMMLPSIYDIFKLHYYETQQPLLSNFELQADGGNWDQRQLSTGGDGSSSALARTNEGEMTWKFPKISKNTIKPKEMKISIPLINSAPRSALIHDNTKATEAQMQKWKAAVMSELKLSSDSDWEPVALSWAMWCANNGTSENLDENQVMEVKDDLGGVIEVPIAAFVKPARENGGLRRIMRHYSNDVMVTIATHQIITKWGLAHGIHKFPEANYAFDFFVPHRNVSMTGLNILKQARLAAIGTGVHNDMLTSNTTNLRRTSNKRINDYDGHEDALE